jgi:UDP:flavonoid glycosyltransferase YjiC (YdhE family)
MNVNKKPRKVFVLVPPMTGHINPITGIISELIKQNVEVTFYSTSNYKPLIEKCGATFREYKYELFLKTSCFYNIYILN